MPPLPEPRGIVCFGEALIDFLVGALVPREARVFGQFAGGVLANAAVAVAKLGGRCEFVGMVGQDMFGDFLLDSLREARAGTCYVRRAARANTALAFVSLDAHGERNFVRLRSTGCSATRISIPPALPKRAPSKSAATA